MLRNILFHKVALSGLIFLVSSTPINAQSDTLALYLDRELDRTVEQYYYSDLDSLISYSNVLSDLALENELWHESIKITIQQAYASEYHGKIDLYFQYLDFGNQLINQYDFDSLDPHGSIRGELHYAQGYGHYLSGDMNEAIDAYKLATIQAVAGKDSLLIFDIYGQLGLCYFNRLDYENALLNYDLAQQWLPLAAENYGEITHQYLLAYIERAKGRALYAKGSLIQSERDKTKALEFYYSALERLLSLEKKRSAITLLSRVYKQLAQYYLLEQHIDSAQFYAGKMLDNPASTEVEQIGNSLFAGRVFLSATNYEKARHNIEQALSGSESNFLGKHFSKAQSYYHLGELHACQEEWKPALSYYQRALEQITTNFQAAQSVYKNPDLEEVTFHKEFLEILLLKGDALLQWYRSKLDPQLLLGAIDTYQLAVATVDLMRQGFILSESREFLSAKSVSIYEKTLEACHQAYELGLGDAYLEMAFQTMEQNKSNLLLEAVQDGAAKSYAGVDKNLIDKEHAFKSKIAYLKRQLAGQKQDDPEKAQQWQQEIFAAQQSYQQLITQLESDYPEYYQLKYQVAPISLSVLQDQLSEGDQALIEYFYGDSSLFVMGISRDDIFLKKIKHDRDLEQLLTSYIKRNQHYYFGTEPEPQSTFMDDGYILYQQLLDPVLSSFGTKIKNLQIIPDGLLGYLPFDILLTKPSPNGPPVYKSLPYLIKSYTISTEFSATLWQKATTDQPDRSFPYLGFAPSFEGPNMTSGRLALRGGGENLLAPLRFNQKEVTEAQKLFGGQAFLGPAATEADFKQFAPNSKILHLSTHAFARDQQVQYSGLVFYQTADSSDETNDGYLYLDELYNMQLSSELAVLSACQTATGELVRGEGIMSLGRAFKYAGCPNIVMSLWSVPDQSTSQIMKYFYQGLKDGQGKAGALRQAKLRYLETADFNTADPYYWAAFTLIGDDQPLTTGSNKYKRILFLLLGLLLVSGLGFWGYRKTRR